MSTLRVYYPHTAEIQVGDMVQTTRNKAELDQINGERYAVRRIAEDSVAIAVNGRAVALAADPHLDRAYAITAQQNRRVMPEPNFHDSSTQYGHSPANLSSD